MILLVPVFASNFVFTWVIPIAWVCACVCASVCVTSENKAYATTTTMTTSQK